MQIGDLSRSAGVNIETIRYYERIGVLPERPRQTNGRRSYGETDARRLSFVRHARDLGFDLLAVRTLLALQEKPEASCEDASRIAQTQLDEVESRIARLLQLQAELSRMARECREGVVAECRVIEALSGRHDGGQATKGKSVLANTSRPPAILQPGTAAAVPATCS